MSDVEEHPSFCPCVFCRDTRTRDILVENSLRTVIGVEVTNTTCPGSGKPSSGVQTMNSCASCGGWFLLNQHGLVVRHSPDLVAVLRWCVADWRKRAEDHHAAWRDDLSVGMNTVVDELETVLNGYKETT